jgi:hypothetical protein
MLRAVRDHASTKHILEDAAGEAEGETHAESGISPIVVTKAQTGRQPRFQALRALLGHSSRRLTESGDRSGSGSGGGGGKNAVVDEGAGSGGVRVGKEEQAVNGTASACGPVASSGGVSPQATSSTPSPSGEGLRARWTSPGKSDGGSSRGIRGDRGRRGSRRSMFAARKKQHAGGMSTRTLLKSALQVLDTSVSMKNLTIDADEGSDDLLSSSSDEEADDMVARAKAVLAGLKRR